MLNSRHAVFLTCASFVVASPTLAHHSPAAFDTQRVTTLEGVVRRYEWRNPHVYIDIETEANGESVVWELEGQTPSILERLGWSADLLRPGDRVVVDGNPARNATRHAARITSLTKQGGPTLRAIPGADDTVVPLSLVPAKDLSGTWLPMTQAYLSFIGPPTGWSLTEKGKEAIATFSEEDNEVANCISPAAPFIMTWLDLRQIEIRADVALIRVAHVDDLERVVSLGATSHDEAEFTTQGHSVGRFDGDALVVDTTHFSDHSSGNRLGLRSGPRKHLVERFELSSDRTRLTYSYILEDPEFLSEPFIGSAVWMHRPDLQYTPYDCDMESAQRYIAE